MRNAFLKTVLMVLASSTTHLAMAFIQTDEIQWNEGELKIHRLLHPPSATPIYSHNPTSPFLTPNAARNIARAPLLAVGAVDEQGRPWTSLWSNGEAGFMGQVGPSMIGIKVPVDGNFDPVVQALMNGPNGSSAGNMMDGSKDRKMFGALSINLATRSRAKLFGIVVAGALQTGEAQLVVRIEQSMVVCPKYIPRHQLEAGPCRPTLLADSIPLPQRALDVIAKADFFFISSANEDQDMDTTNRGGPAGFVRVMSNTENDCALVWPEYSGNRLYQTLGNLANNPRAGLVFPDFENGDVLYVSGTTETLIGAAAEEILPHSNLALLFHVSAVRFVREGLHFRARAGEPSPYNPRVRYLRTETATVIANGHPRQQLRATLVKQDKLTPSIFRARFRVSGPDRTKESSVTWKPGQYVALSFEDELSMGYSHMRDDDPRSINDDFVRSFTVSSMPRSALPRDLRRSSEQWDQPAEDEFEITYRALGTVTNFLSRQHARSGLEVAVRGFEGSFSLPATIMETPDLVGFVAAGVGITPLLAHLPILDQTATFDRVRLLWTVRYVDLNLVVDTLKRFPTLGSGTHLFVTGAPSMPLTPRELGACKAVSWRRLTKEDVVSQDQDGVDDIRKIKVWYICATPVVRDTVKLWLEQGDDGQESTEKKEIIVESFDY